MGFAGWTGIRHVLLALLLKTDVQGFLRPQDDAASPNENEPVALQHKRKMKAVQLFVIDFFAILHGEPWVATLL